MPSVEDLVNKEQYNPHCYDIVFFFFFSVSSDLPPKLIRRLQVRVWTIWVHTVE